MMLVVVPCGAHKIWDSKPDAGTVPAQDAYTSAFFKTNRRYAEHFGDASVILSAKFGFICPTALIPGPYDVSFNRPSSGPISDHILRDQVQALYLASFDRIVGLGGAAYRKRIEAAFAETESLILFPFAGVRGLGYMMQATQKAISTSSMPG